MLDYERIEFSEQFDKNMFYKLYGEAQIELELLPLFDEAITLADKSLNIRKIYGSNKVYLAVWLDEKYDLFLNSKKMLGERFLIATVANSLLMQVADLFRERRSCPTSGLAKSRCTPLPPAFEDLIEVISFFGIAHKDKNIDSTQAIQLALPYAFVTYFDSQYGCKDCSLLKKCPHLA